MPRKNLNLNLPRTRTFLAPASLWKRIVALIFDLLILNFLVVGPFRNVIAAMLGGSSDFHAIYAWLETNPYAASGIAMIFGLIGFFTLVYFVLMNYLAGQSIGQILLNIHVISVYEKTSKKKFVMQAKLPGFWQSVLRNLFALPMFPFYFLWIIDPIYLIFSRTRQRLTESLSKTMVVEKLVPYY